ncbi:MAG: acylphosphatase [Methanosarcinaceae archaeon]|nr:acylphosphatase [Methanosarcinaceae archaeon]
MQPQCKKINITGIVQGVGFRPFVYRFAKDYDLHGCVKNLGNNVEIVVERRRVDIDRFLRDLTARNPPLSSIGGVSKLPYHKIVVSPIFRYLVVKRAVFQIPSFRRILRYVRNRLRIYRFMG